ncbi:hypothetical protein FACS1894123_03950 [Bacteroidia bacterium]|nr:hypothetical protein FACS1894123_03950 [Bacteroidia bacterium]
MVKCGVATVEGEVTGEMPIEMKDRSKSLTLLHLNPFFFPKHYTALPDSNGNFSFEIPVYCEGYGSISSATHTEFVYLTPGKKTKLIYSYNSSLARQINMNNNHLSEFYHEFWHNWNCGLQEINIDSLLQIHPDAYARRILNILEEQLSLITTHNKLSENAKQYLSINAKAYFLVMYLLNYETYQSAYYRKLAKIGKAENFSPEHLERNYYSFLRDLDLNNPQYLIAWLYSDVMQRILRNKTFNISSIGDTPIEEWQKEVKTALADLVGTDNGLFYEVLTVNAYQKQFNEEKMPLSKKQKQNVKKYFKNKSFSQMVLAKDKELINTTNLLRRFGHVGKTPDTSNVQFLDSIISKHKGKVVLVDFWKSSIVCKDRDVDESVEIEKELGEKDVVFVYFKSTSNRYSQAWEKKMKEINAEHYSLSSQEWENLASKYRIGDHFTTYLLFDTNGVLKREFYEHPGVGGMVRMIEELLP